MFVAMQTSKWNCSLIIVHNINICEDFIILVFKILTAKLLHKLCSRLLKEEVNHFVNAALNIKHS